METTQMAIKVHRTNILIIYTTTFVLGTIIGFGAVHSTSITLIPIIRILALFTTAVTLTLYLSTSRMQSNAFFGLLLFSLFSAYGIYRGIPLFGKLYPIRDYALSLIVIALGIVNFSILRQTEAQNISARALLAFFWAWTLFLFLSGGLVLSFPPHYKYQIYLENGNLIWSSQALTKFYAIASLLSLTLGIQSRIFLARSLYYSSTIAFTFLSFLAGSRGEFIFLIVCVILILTSGSLTRKLSAALLSYILYLALSWGIQNMAAEIGAFERYKLLFIEGNFSMRGTLIYDSLNLLKNQPKCLLVGCGFAYFQDYYGFDYGLYPHNSLLEATITWGFPAFLILILLIAIGAKHIRWSQPFPQIGLLSLLISLKSGDLMGGWLAMSFAFYLAGSGFANLTSGFWKPYSRLTSGGLVKR